MNKGITAVARGSSHQEPIGVLAISRHYVRDLVYGASDGLITTFAVVAGVAGGGLSHTTMLVVGVANLAADGLSMAVGNYLAIRAHEGALEAQGLPIEEASPLRHAFATFCAFAGAGIVPLAPYLVAGGSRQFATSIALTLLTLFGVGAARGVVTNGRWLVAGTEMLSLGVLASAAAYWVSALVVWQIG